MMHILMNSVLENVWIWGMALTYFFIYVIRQGVTSWSIFFLMNQKGVPDAGSAGFMVSGLEARPRACAALFSLWCCCAVAGSCGSVTVAYTCAEACEVRVALVCAIFAVSGFCYDILLGL